MATLGFTTTAHTDDGTIKAGAKQIILYFSSDYTGLVNGMSFTPFAGGSLNFGPFDYDRTDAITYTTTTGTIYELRVD